MFYDELKYFYPENWKCLTMIFSIFLNAWIYEILMYTFPKGKILFRKAKQIFNSKCPSVTVCLSICLSKSNGWFSWLLLWIQFLMFYKNSHYGTYILSNFLCPNSFCINQLPKFLIRNTLINNYLFHFYLYLAKLLCLITYGCCHSCLNLFTLLPLFW